MLRLGTVAFVLLLPRLVLAQVSPPGQPQNFGGPPKPPTAADCAVVDVSGEAMECGEGMCSLVGSVELRCATTRLNADHVDVFYDDKQQFAGAHAKGHVLYVQDRHVMTCNDLVVGPDHIQGKVNAAIFRVKLTPPDLSKPGLPPGRNMATFRGDIERQSQSDYKVYDGDFTLCDCGLEPPSWRVTAKEIDAHLGDRATLWWPTFRLRPFSLFELPIPMAPISLPLSRRAFGIMPINPRFLGGRPILDLPIFIPIGDQFDLELIPGTRMDWAPPTTFNPSTWGAPRLGGRMRWAPTQTWYGELDWDYTYDGGNWRSKNAAARPFADPGDVLGSANLTHRLAINGLQRATIGENLDWNANVNWMSDDALLRDFAQSIRDATSNYLSSRTELFYRPEGFSALASADYFVITNDFNNSTMPLKATPNGQTIYDYSNTGGRERDTMHRMPFVRVNLEPLQLTHGVQVDADASFVRYGRITSLPANIDPSQARLTDPLSIGNVVGGITYADRLSAFNVYARASTDSLFTSLSEQAHALTSVMLDARIDTRLSRRFGSVLHTITPRVAYRSIAAQAGTLPAIANNTTTAPLIYDPRMQREIFHQVEIAIDQALWVKGPLSALPVLNLNIRQPFDMQSGRLLQTQAELFWRAPYYLTGSVRTSLAPNQQDFVREISATTQLTLRYFNFGVGYANWKTTADRFRRSIYELAAPVTPVVPVSQQGAAQRPIHTISITTGVNLKNRVIISYNSDYLLPIAERFLPQQQLDPVNFPNVTRLEDLPANRRTFVEHRASIIYRSPCNCWGITANMAFPNSDQWWAQKRINLLFDIGGYTLGN